ncbi:ergothioneine biosynthesis protein EgtB [bacterium]|nr:ergothioneine biosynthesis protein EgtB [bacterium]
MPTTVELAARYRAVRGETERLRAPLTPEDCQAQSMPDASPVKWHLAHTTWFFETFLLEPGRSAYQPFHPTFRVLFNSYYQGVGEQHPRPQRGLLTRPSLDEVLAYRAHVDRALLDWLAGDDATVVALTPVLEIGLHHEQQHQELLLTDVKHLFGANPLAPAYAAPPPPASTAAARPFGWRAVDGGVREIGAASDGFAFDNERPRHAVLLEPFELATRLTTSGEYAAFIADGGYRRPELWLADGWSARQARGWEAPLYWEQRDGEWHELTLGGRRRVDPLAPVCHVSFYEADAFATWAGARLPTEVEWETAAAGRPVHGNLLDSGRLHPTPVGANGSDIAQLYGDVWEWTRSAYAPYPGFRPLAGTLGEYNGKFMCNQLVLRGGSCATPADHVRATYRNFFPPDARWQFSGIRLAR